MVWSIFATVLLGTLPGATGQTVNRRDHVAGNVPISTRAAGDAAAVAHRRCGDFLADMGKKPAHLVFAGCRYAPDEQGKPLHATYRVSGRYAADTEAFLIKAAGLNRLRLSCCQWDAPPGWFKDARGRDYSITMTSVESVYLTRASWKSIPLFEVEVQAFTEEI